MNGCIVFGGRENGQWNVMPLVNLIVRIDWLPQNNTKVSEWVDVGRMGVRVIACVFIHVPELLYDGVINEVDYISK